VRVLNIHERELPSSLVRAGGLIDSLASSADTLWPSQSWPRMKFDGALSIGAVGGHGPIRYSVEDYKPGQSIRFRFTGPSGFDGYHGFELLAAGGPGCGLRHTLQIRTHGVAMLSWPIVFRPLHDALIEDSLAQAEASLGRAPNVHKWSTWVKILRYLLSKGKSRRQAVPRIGAESNPTDI
jgi:hypothetical protein